MAGETTKSTIGNLTDHVWRTWVTATTGSTSITCTDSVWRAWNGVSTGTMHHSLATNTAVTSWGDTTSAVWQLWQDMPHDRARIEHVRTAPPPPTPEQLAERERIREAARKADAEREAIRVKAKKRARALLVSHLTPQQRATYERDGYFDVDVAGRMFRINQGTHGNVSERDDRGTIARYCGQPDDVPAEDAMLSQLLALRFAPQEFFRNANRTVFRN